MKTANLRKYRALSTVCLLLACRDGSGPSGPTVRDYIVAVRTSVAGSTAEFRSGTIPNAGAGVAITATSLGAFILGGTAPVQITANSQFSRLIVAIDGARGYWDVALPSSSRIALYLTLSQELPQESFNLSYAGGNGGALGPFKGAPIGVRPVGTGDVQVSVSWDVLSDLDLHVTDPAGSHIYWNNRTAASGGQLDLDSNPACDIDRINNENVTWPLNKAPNGQYTVAVNLYASCATTTTSYTVTVTQKGKDPQVYFGTVVPPATPNSSGKVVTTFVR
jgi:hypothetical protein